jgi:hypothetical protein
MSQRNVERVIGRLVTDEAFRSVYLEDPDRALRILAELGVELTACERDALRRLDADDVKHFASRINPCLQKSDLGGGLK